MTSAIKDASEIIYLEPWVTSILANPISKQPIDIGDLVYSHGVPDARVFLKNTHGYSGWAQGQNEYESWAVTDNTSADEYKTEIDYDRPIYTHFSLTGRILDCGGGAGTVREFLPRDVEFVSVDPWLFAPISNSVARKNAYSCLNRPLNFIAATAEFLPFVANSFDWVHMRSMLDHVQVPDLALLEARRVLQPDGRVLIGLYVEGGKQGVVPPLRRIRDAIKVSLSIIGIKRWKDHHVWHPTYKALVQLLTDNGFHIEDIYWQPRWKDSVCYVCARKT